MGRVYDVIVIGATIAGLTSAIKLAQRGAQVAVLDPNPAPASAALGHGIAAVSLLGEPDEGAGRPVALRARVSALASAIELIEQWAAERDVPAERVTLLERTINADDRSTEAQRLRGAGVEIRPSHEQPLAGLDLAPGWGVAQQLIVDPVRYAEALHDIAAELGVTVAHNVTITRFRRHQVLHAVHYRSQLAWERGMLADWSARVVDTQAVSPWGRHARTDATMIAPVALAEGVAISSVLSLRDAPSRLIRPWGDGALIVGHPVPAAAIETASMGLRHWVDERLGWPVAAMSSFGIEPRGAGEETEGAAVIPGGFWSGGHGLWELASGTASGLALAERLLHDRDHQQRLPVLSRLRASVRTRMSR